MLDRASIDRLSRAPEKNAPMLNVALAEEGTAAVLLSLARSPALGPEALAVVAERVAAEGDEVGRDPDVQAEDHVSAAAELDRLLVAHPRASDAVRDAVLARHPGDAFFVLAAASHAGATAAATRFAVDWPSASPAHDRLWLGLVDPAAVPPLTLEEWSQDESPLRREAAARIARDPALHTALAHDPARQVRRALASNRFAAAARARLAAADPAPDVRARAAVPLTSHGEAGDGKGVESARFAAALRAMASGGVLAPDVVRALSGASGELDDEGAFLAGQVLPRPELGALVDRIVGEGLSSPRSRSLAAGLALRPVLPWGATGEGDDAGAGEGAEHTEIVYDAVKALSRTTTAESRLTGKARLAAWAAEGLARCEHVDRDHVVADLARRPIAGERMILVRAASLRPEMVAELCASARAGGGAVPGALLELAWADPRIPDAQLVDLASRIPRPKKRAEDLPEDEVDLDPLTRPLEMLERVVLAAAVRANVSPRAALAAVALDARRVRYVLSAMPQWKGRLSGGRLARVLRQHAGAISVAQSEARARASRVESWTERLLTELELSVALAVGHLTGAEVVRRIGIGRQPIDDGIDLATGAEARAALEGPAAVQPILGGGPPSTAPPTAPPSPSGSCWRSSTASEGRRWSPPPSTASLPARAPAAPSPRASATRSPSPSNAAQAASKTSTPSRRAGAPPWPAPSPAPTGRSAGRGTSGKIPEIKRQKPKGKRQRAEETVRPASALALPFAPLHFAFARSPPGLASLPGVGSHPRMRCSSLALLVLLRALAGCSPPLPADVAPPRASTPRAPYTKGVPAPDVQPEVANPFVRDARAEGILAHIGAIEGHAGRAYDDARLKRKGQPDACLARALTELGSVDRKARARRNELRDAAFEDPDGEDALFKDLAGLAARANQLAGDCPALATYRQGSEYTLRMRELEGRVGGLKDQIRAVPGSDSGGIVLTGPLTGAPAVRQTRSAVRSFTDHHQIVQRLPQYRMPAAFSAAPAPPSPPPPPAAAPAASPFARGGPHDASMLLRSAQLALAVFEVDKKMDAVQAIAADLGGYLALRGDREITVRVPRERFDEALRRIEAVGDVLHRSVAAEDVTDQFVDLELRLRNAQAVRARLEKLLETASVKDAVEIHKELTKITEEVERLSGKLKLLKDRIAFSTLTVTFERTEPQHLKSQALLPFPWMRTMGLGPLLQVSR